MNKEIKSTPHFPIIGQLLVSVVSPVALLISAKLYWEVLKITLDIGTIIILGALGVFAIWGFNYKMKEALSDLPKNEKKLSFTTKLGVYSLLMYPLFGAIFMIVVTVTNSANDIYMSPSNDLGGINNVSHKLKPAVSNSDKNTAVDLAGSNSTSPVFVSTEFDWFKPELSHVASMKEQFLEQSLSSLVLLDPRNNLTESELKKTQQTVNKLLPLLRQKKWDDLMHYINHEAESPSEAASVIINVAVNFDAPDELYLNLVNKGGKFISTSLLALVQKGKLDTVLKMENYGVTLNSEVFKNTNTLHFAMLAPLTPKSFDFLINQVEVIDKVGQLGVDLIGLSIINADTNADYISHYLEQMIERGASVKPQHYQLMKGLKKENEIIYEEIVEIIPELTVD